MYNKHEIMKNAWDIRKSAGVSMSVALVALLTEGVGRNKGSGKYADDVFVALLAEGVGRNKYGQGVPVSPVGRPPRGGRG